MVLLTHPTVLNGSSELCVDVHLAVVAFGVLQVMSKTCGFKCGVLVVTDTENVTVIDAETGLVLVEVSTIQKLLVRTVDVHIQFALAVFIDVVQENVQDVMDVLPM